MRYLLACFIIIFLILNTSSVEAQEVKKLPQVTPGQVNEALNNLTPVRFLPNNPLYFLIRGKEIVARLFQPSFRERAQFDYSISSKRLKEAYLISTRGDMNKINGELGSYIKTLGKIEGQLEKARSQNQDITVVVDKIADNLQFQEVILSALGTLKNQDTTDYKSKLEESLDSLGMFVLYLDKIKPGVKGRFQIFVVEGSSLKTSDVDMQEASASPHIEGESTSQAKPRRIIY